MDITRFLFASKSVLRNLHANVHFTVALKVLVRILPLPRTSVERQKLCKPLVIQLRFLGLRMGDINAGVDIGTARIARIKAIVHLTHQAQAVITRLQYFGAKRPASSACARVANRTGL